jgi:predicted GIY-YIG superfamily endonuclease
MSASINWEKCQDDSDRLLADGLWHLQGQPLVASSHVPFRHAGNYLISLREQVVYIGEAKNLAARVMQQFTAKTSTFFKNYSKMDSAGASLSDFRVRYAETRIGRKELEEFGIVNIGCRLNRFQLGKRAAVSAATDSTAWKLSQAARDALLAEGEVAVFSRPFVNWSAGGPSRCAGLYVVRAPDDRGVLYIGESSDISERYKTHSRATYFSALRRHVGTEILGFTLAVRNGKAKYFSDEEDCAVTAFLLNCRIAWLPVRFGRFELEEHLIRKYQPRLNRKDKVA